MIITTTTYEIICLEKSALLKRCVMQGLAAGEGGQQYIGIGHGQMRHGPWSAWKELRSTVGVRWEGVEVRWGVAGDRWEGGRGRGSNEKRLRSN